MYFPSQKQVGPPVFKGRPTKGNDNKDSKKQTNSGNEKSSSASSNNQSNLPSDIANAGNNINKEASSTPPDPLKQTKAQANKEQDKNPPTGPQKGATGNVKPPPAQEQGNSQQASIGEAGDQDKETNEKGW